MWMGPQDIVLCGARALGLHNTTIVSMEQQGALLEGFSHGLIIHQSQIKVVGEILFYLRYHRYSNWLILPSSIDHREMVVDMQIVIYLYL